MDLGETARRIRARLRPRQRWRDLAARRIRDRLAGPKAIEAFADAYPQAFFIEIGSNDGEQHDHLSPMIKSREWRGIMVEPVPYVFERLRRNYAGTKSISFENAAIADHDGQLPFFHLAEAGAGERGASRAGTTRSARSRRRPSWRTPNTFRTSSSASSPPRSRA